MKGHFQGARVFNACSLKKLESQRDRHVVCVRVYGESTMLYIGRKQFIKSSK